MTGKYTVIMSDFNSEVGMDTNSYENVGKFGEGTRNGVGQVAQVARRLAAGWTARVRSRVSEGWRFFFTPSCPDWPWGPLNLL